MYLDCMRLLNREISLSFFLEELCWSRKSSKQTFRRLFGGLEFGRLIQSRRWISGEGILAGHCKIRGLSVVDQVFWYCGGAQHRQYGVEDFSLPPSSR